MTAGRTLDWTLAFGAGVLLACMIGCNSLLAARTTPVFASWVVHGLGACAALLLASTAARLPGAAAAPRWSFLGGLPGAFAVILASVTVNGGLGLAATVALVLVGQVLFGLACESRGWLGSPRRALAAGDGLAALCSLAGSALILFGGSAR
jgi:transporter family-2 protein